MAGLKTLNAYGKILISHPCRIKPKCQTETDEHNWVVVNIMIAVADRGGGGPADSIIQHFREVQYAYTAHLG